MLGDDVRFPEVARVQLVQEATIIATGMNATDAVWRPLALNRASENKLYVAASNRVGREGGVQYTATASSPVTWQRSPSVRAQIPSNW